MEQTDRRQFLGKLAVLALPGVLAANPSTSSAIQFDPKDPKAKEAYLKDVEEMGRARWGRQPTRLDVQRTVPKMVRIVDVNKGVKTGLDSGDLAAVAAVIGDQSIDASSKNLKRDKDVSDLQKAKPYMYRYAQAFSKASDSPLTTDMKTQLDAYFASMSATREEALKGSLDGAKAAYAEADKALNLLVDMVEQETLNGRLNQVKVSLGVLVGKGELGVLNTYKANMEEITAKPK